MTLEGNISSSQVCTSSGIMVGSILIQIFTPISTYVNTQKARWCFQITTINLTSVLSALPSTSLVLQRKSSCTHKIQLSSWRSSRGHKNFFSRSVVSKKFHPKVKSTSSKGKKVLTAAEHEHACYGIECPISSPKREERMSSALSTFHTGHWPGSLTQGVGF